MLCLSSGWGRDVLPACPYSVFNTAMQATGLPSCHRVTKELSCCACCSNAFLVAYAARFCKVSQLQQHDVQQTPLLVVRVVAGFGAVEAS